MNVIKTHCAWREEEIVDYILGRLPVEKRLILQNHLELCDRCRGLHEEWGQMLDFGEKEDGYVQENVNENEPENENENEHENELELSRQQRLPVGVHAAPGSVPVTAGPEWMPSSRVKRKLMWKIRMDQWKKRIFFSHRPRYQAALGALILLAALVPLLPFSRQVQQLNPVEGLGTVQQVQGQDDAAEASLMMNPHTVQYAVRPVKSPQLKGYAWVNHSSGEILILVEGLKPSNEKDYQVWFVTANKRSNAGLLNWKNGMGHLYSHGSMVGSAENIAVSVEPKGGSFQPTGPDTMFVSLHAFQ